MNFRQSANKNNQLRDQGFSFFSFSLSHEPLPAWSRSAYFLHFLSIFFNAMPKQGYLPYPHSTTVSSVFFGSLRMKIFFDSSLFHGLFQAHASAWRNGVPALALTSESLSAPVEIVTLHGNQRRDPGGNHGHYARTVPPRPAPFRSAGRPCCPAA